MPAGAAPHATPASQGQPDPSSAAKVRPEGWRLLTFAPLLPTPSEAHRPPVLARASFPGPLARTPYYCDRLESHAELRHGPANHLDALCRRGLNKMASALIRERILTAAQRRLGHSALGVAQGAYEPGFEDASYSVRYFRKYTGITPEAFWQQRWFVLQVPALGLRRRG